jgi:thymidylate kinase
METYRIWLRLFQLQPHYSWIIDRFHLSTQVYQQNHRQKTYDFEWLEAGLQDLGFHLVLCVRSPESFKEARAERIKVSGNPTQYDNLQVFIDEQEDFLRLAHLSALPVLEVDVSNGNLDRGAEEIADWMAKTGGLWPRETFEGRAL